MIDGLVHPRFAAAASRFERMFRKPDAGGGAFAVYYRGEVVVDVWSGWADPDNGKPWQADTLALSFSTSKGVISTLAHCLIEDGTLDLDVPIATYWPEFAVNGKETITLRHVMTHTAGLHDIRGLVGDAQDLIDHDAVIATLATQTPRPAPGVHAGYHALTYGWLMTAIIQKATGRDVRELLRELVADRIDAPDLHFGLAPEHRHRLAPLIGGLAPRGMPIAKLAQRTERVKRLRSFSQALLVDGFEELVINPAGGAIYDTVMPAANGVFTARSLAKMYGALANTGQVDGQRLLEARTVRDIQRVQRTERDYVLGIPMQWRLGFHRIFTVGRQPKTGFGHFGFGGSGAWADPASGLSLAFTTNRLGTATTPVGDARLARLGRLVLDAVEA